jgi:hypothetical protein
VDVSGSQAQTWSSTLHPAAHSTVTVAVPSSLQ